MHYSESNAFLKFLVGPGLALSEREPVTSRCRNLQRCGRPAFLNLYNGGYVFLQGFQATISPGLGPGGAECADDRPRVHRDDVCRKHQRMALPFMGAAFWGDQPGPLG